MDHLFLQFEPRIGFVFANDAANYSELYVSFERIATAQKILSARKFILHVVKLHQTKSASHFENT